MKQILPVLLSSITIFSTAQDFEGIKKINGANLYVSIRGTGEPLVVVHGGPGLNHSYFKPHLQQLEKSFRVVYYDQRANGQSSVPSPDSLTLKFFTDDLEGLRHELKAEKLNILAHSWGAVPAIHYALKYPGRIKKLVLSNPAMLSREFDKDIATMLTTRMSKEDSLQRTRIVTEGNIDRLKYERLMLLTFRTSAFDPQNMNQLHFNIPANVMVANRTLFTGLMNDPQAKANLYDSLKSFRFPVLLIHGEADIVPPAALQRLKNYLPEANVVVFKKSGHFPFVEEKEKYNAVVVGFIKKKK